MWMGGNLPLGYDAPADASIRALRVNEVEAETVREIFRIYLDLRSVHALERWLDERAIRSKAWISSRGRMIGGLRFSRGALFHLLKNRTYVGEVPHRDRSYPGLHPPIIDRDVFDAVQGLLTGQARRHRDRPTRVSTMMLRGLIFDASGEPMSPTFTHGAKGQLYRYYVSSPLQQGKKLIADDNIRRLPADAIEALVQSLLERLRRDEEVEVRRHVARVEVHSATVQVIVKRASFFARPSDALAELQTLRGRLGPNEYLNATESDESLARVTLPCRLKIRGGRAFITDEAGQSLVSLPRVDRALVGALRRAHAFLHEAGGAPVGAVERAFLGSAPPGPHERKVLALAFLAPDLQEIILNGRQPAGLSLQRLIEGELPLAWEDQRRLFT